MLCAYFTNSASSLVQSTHDGAFFMIESANSDAFLCATLFDGVPMTLTNGFSTSYLAVATERNSGQNSTMMPEWRACSLRLVPGTTVDLMIAILPFPISLRAPSTMDASKPFGVEGVGTATNTTSQSFINSLLPMYGSSSEYLTTENPLFSKSSA